MFPYSKVYGDALSGAVCKNLIYLFELYQDQQIKIDIDGHVKFTEININKSDVWGASRNHLLGVCAEYLSIYKKEFSIQHFQFPKKYGLEEIRIKRYYPNNYDEFKLHVDVDTLDSSKRMISYLFYLNDVEEGGETTFGLKDEWAVKPKAGNLLMFPPLWTHPHRGKPPLSGPKYIISTYVNFA